MEIKKSQLRGLVREQLTAFFVTPEPFATVGRTKELDDAIKQPNEEKEINKEALKDVIRQVVADVEKASTNRMKSGVGGELNPNGTIAEAKGSTKWYDAIKRPVKVGDRVHVGHKQKGGAGIEGIVTKIEGDKVHIKDPNPKSRRTWYGALKNTSIIEIYGVDSLKPNDPHTPEDEAEKDAADDVMEASPRLNPKEKYTVVALRPSMSGPVKDVTGNPKWKVFDQMHSLSPSEVKLFIKMSKNKYKRKTNYAPSSLRFSVEDKGGKRVHSESWERPPRNQSSGWVRPNVTTEAREVGSLASNPKSKALIKKMHALVTKQLKLKSIEDIQPLKDGVGFIFSDKKESAKMANYLKKAGVFGKSVPLAAGGSNRTLVTLKLK